MQGGFPLANIVVELISEQGDGTFELRPGAPKVLSAALDALFFSGTDPMAGLEPALRLLLVLIEDKKSPGAARELLSVILARPEVPPLLEKYSSFAYSPVFSVVAPWPPGASPPSVLRPHS